MSSTSSFQSLSLLPRQVISHYPRAYAHATSVLCTCGLLWLANVAINAYENWRMLPGGPWGIPFIGYLPFLKKKEPTYIQFHKMAKKYGPVFRFKLGGKHIVVISDWTNMQEAFDNVGLAGRPEQTMFPGIITHQSFLEMSGNHWKKQRSRSMTIIQQVLDGQQLFEDRVKAEIGRLVYLIRNHIGALDFGPALARSLSNNITIVLFGRIYDYDDPVKKEFDEHVEKILSEHQLAELLVCSPWLARMYLACGRSNLNQIAESVEFADRFFQQEVDRHTRNVNVSIPEPIDYFDGYIKELATRERLRLTEGPWNLETMKRNAFAYYFGEVEKLNSTMLWMIHYLIKYPEIQERLREDVISEIGYIKVPDFRDHRRLPYVMAFINEVHRMGSVVAVNLMRRAQFDVFHRGYLIPKDTFVLFNFWSIHRDPDLYPEPEIFDPDRFLIPAGSGVDTPPYLLAFSDGKRSCPGENISTIQLFLYLVCLLQKFRIKVAPKCQVSSEVSFRITRRPARLPPLVFENIQN